MGNESKRKFKRRIGYESDAGRLIRDRLSRPGGCLLFLVYCVMLTRGDCMVGGMTLKLKGKLEGGELAGPE